MDRFQILKLPYERPIIIRGLPYIDANDLDRGAAFRDALNSFPTHVALVGDKNGNLVEEIY